MEIDLNGARPPEPKLPAGYRWVAWRRSLLDRHAAVKYRSFCGEVDAEVFPSLSTPAGCRRLMYEIAGQKSFLPQATWLIVYQPAEGGPCVDCGTVQGLAATPLLGSVQNVGVVPEHRGVGLGRALVLQALKGFRAAGLRRVYLEVTAENMPAVELYGSLGFRLSRTMYKPMRAESGSRF